MGSMAGEKSDRRGAGTPRPPDGELSDYPEIATTQQWRDRVREARLRQGMTQPQLAARLGTTQPTISDIETGKIAASKLVTPISEVLKIATPYAAVEDDLERRWIEAGRLLRARNRAVFNAQLLFIEQLLAGIDAADAESETEVDREH